MKKQQRKFITFYCPDGHTKEEVGIDFLYRIPRCVICEKYMRSHKGGEKK